MESLSRGFLGDRLSATLVRTPECCFANAIEAGCCSATLEASGRVELTASAVAKIIKVPVNLFRQTGQSLRLQLQRQKIQGHLLEIAESLRGS